MCGINGIAALSMQTNINEVDVRSMLPALHHRGPDGSGVYIDPYQRIGLVTLASVLSTLRVALSPFTTRIKRVGHV
jgi:hypothetical protein